MKKLKLSDLKVKSFVTTEEAKQINGGSGVVGCAGTGPLCDITFIAGGCPTLQIICKSKGLECFELPTNATC